MTLRQYNVVMRVPVDWLPSGFYYWQSVFYYDSSDFPTMAQAANRASNIVRIHALDVTQVTRVIVTEPPGSGTVLANIPFFSAFGFIASGGAPYTLINCGRFTTRYSDGRASYKLWRSPSLDSWFTGRTFGSFAVARMESFINNMKAVSGFPATRNRYGALCIGGEATNLVHGWQMRHGTKRREYDYA